VPDLFANTPYLRTVPGAFDWAAEKTGLPRWAWGPADWLTSPSIVNHVPQYSEVEGFLQRNPWLNSVPAGLASLYARRIKDGATNPEADLPGSLSKIIDAGAEAALSGPMVGAVGPKALGIAATVGAGSEAAGQIAHKYDEDHGTNWEDKVRRLRDILGLIPSGR
jgi:hypothetical protein